MQTPKLFRPMLLTGLIVVALAVFSLLLVPGWLSSPWRLAVLVIAILAGLYAVIRDLLSLYKEIRRLADEHNRRNSDK